MCPKQEPLPQWSHTLLSIFKALDASKDAIQSVSSFINKSVKLCASFCQPVHVPARQDFNCIHIITSLNIPWLTYRITGANYFPWQLSAKIRHTRNQKAHSDSDLCRFFRIALPKTIACDKVLLVSLLYTTAAHFAAGSVTASASDVVKIA